MTNADKLKLSIDYLRELLKSHGEQRWNACNCGLNAEKIEIIIRQLEILSSRYLEDQ